MVTLEVSAACFFWNADHITILTFKKLTVNNMVLVMKNKFIPDNATVSVTIWFRNLDTWKHFHSFMIPCLHMFTKPIIQLFHSLKKNGILLLHTFLPLLCSLLEEHHTVPSLARDFHHIFLMHTEPMPLFWTAQSQMTSRSIQCLLNHIMG